MRAPLKLAIAVIRPKLAANAMVADEEAVRIVPLLGGQQLWIIALAPERRLPIIFKIVGFVPVTTTVPVVRRKFVKQCCLQRVEFFDNRWDPSLPRCQALLRTSLVAVVRDCRLANSIKRFLLT